MAALSESSVLKKISDIVECSICKEPFKEAKMLPCIHTFCLHCLQTYGKDQDPLEKSTCPLCRKEFTIPSGGFKDLPSNFFMNQLLQLNQLSSLIIGETTETSKKLCEFCSDKKAKAYCIECGQYLCNVCASRHKNLKLFKDHQVVSLNQMPSAEELLKMAPSYCQKHPRDEIKFYCYDCKMIACMVCYVDNKHNKHECSDIMKSGEEFRKLLQKDIDNVNACSLAIDQQLKLLVEERRKLADRVKSVKGEISVKYEYTKALLDSQKNKLMADLDSFEREKMKEYEIRKNEVEMQFGIMESFNRYCQEMKDKGTPCALSSSADDLHRRANELVKARKENMTTPLASVDVKFTPSSTTETMIGQLGFSVFDSMLFRPQQSTDIPQYGEIQRALRDGIVNPLRCTRFVRADKVLRLRRLLDRFGSVKGLIDGQKDPEEFLNSLLGEILKVQPFIKLSSGQSCHLYQLFVDPPKDRRVVEVEMHTTQQLLGLSFYQSNIRLAEVPSCLILQMPRFGKYFQIYKRIVPSLTLDITALLQHGPKPCFVCGQLANIECARCVDDLELETLFYCADCSKKIHSHPRKVGHSPQPLHVDDTYTRFMEEERRRGRLGGRESPLSRETLELFAVVCIKTSHYVAFVKCSSSSSVSPLRGRGRGGGEEEIKGTPWVFFDSMADRIGQAHGYNIPEISECPFLPGWLQEDRRRNISPTVVQDKDLPEHVRRVLCDAYICMYEHTDLAQ